MGLSERIKQYQQQKLEEAKDLEKLNVAQLSAEARERLDSDKQSIKFEEKRKAELVASLAPVLEVVSARTQLLEVRKVWGVGSIDPASRIRGDSLDLGLRYSFEDVGVVEYGYKVVDLEAGDKDRWFDAGAELVRHEVALVISTSQTTEGARVNVLYYEGFQRGDAYINKRFKNSIPDKSRVNFPLHDSFRELASTAVDIHNPAQSYAALEDQLFGLYSRSKLPDPRVEEGKAIMRIDANKSIPWYRKLL